MIPAGHINFSEVLDMYVISLAEGDFFIPQIPKGDEVCEVFQSVT